MFTFAPLIAFSGHMGSGKDTVAQAVTERTHTSWVHRSFADPLRAEINAVIADIQHADTLEQAKYIVSMSQQRELDVTGKYSRIMADVVSVLFDDVKAGRIRDATDRTDATRYALQTWGTDLRRSADPGYWIQPMRDILKDELSHSRAVYITDARFPNELDLARQLGGYAIRLNVSDDVQAERLQQRDNIVMTDAMREHPSETAADNYMGFDLAVDTDRRTVESIADEIINTFSLL